MARVPGRWSVALAVAGATEVACLTAIALQAPAGHDFLLPAARFSAPSWLHGPLPASHPGLSSGGFAWLMLVMLAAYCVALVAAARVQARWPLGIIAAGLLIAALAPPLLSGDAFAYVAWGRLGARGIDPYSHPAIAVGHDAVRPFLLWHHGSSPYGPLFTVMTIALAPLGVAAALWTLKGIAAVAALVCLALLWQAAKRRGTPPLGGAVLFGLNPILLVYAVSGAHNDLLLDAVLVAAVLAVVAGRELGGAAGVVAAAAVKASAVLALPFMIAASRRPVRTIAWACAAGAIALAAGVAVFGLSLVDIGTTLRAQQNHVATHSFPAELAALTGLGRPGHAEQALMTAGLATAVVALLVAVRRGADWVTATGWAFVALLLTTSWLLPWYIVWPLPFAALSTGRRLPAAVVVLTIAIVSLRITFPG